MRRSKDCSDLAGTAGQAGGDPRSIEAAAVRLLARREHSTAELRRKLQARGHPQALVAEVVDRLAGKRLVSDERYVASFVHHHAERGQGPVRIRAELRQQGISDGDITEAFAQALERGAVDWMRLAAMVRRRRFGAGRPHGAAERAKQARFLQYRGFEADQIRAALQSGADADEAPPDAETGFELADVDPDL